MVKRQTVWLSTMMVLSLMLIGYYTMNNQAQTTSVDNGGSSISTSILDQGSGSSISGDSSDTTSGSTTSTSGSTSNTTGGSTPTTKRTSASSTSASSNDWFVSQQTSLDQQFSEKIANLQAVISNPNASSSQITQAEDSIKQLTNLKGNLEQARDEVLGDGYKECVIVPDATGTNMHVYVKATTFTNSDAVKVMTIVSQQMDIPMMNILVTQHS